MASPSPRDTPREIIAHALSGAWEHETETGRAIIMADTDRALAALSEHGYTVARLEQAEYVKVRRVVRDFQTTPPSEVMTREAMEPLFRPLESS